MSNDFMYELVGPDAVAPFKKYDSDSGYDLVLIKKLKVIRRGSFGEVAMYDTGVKVKPPEGYYFDMVPRSSLSKLGYALANSVGIIDQDYRNTVRAVLYKYDNSAEKLDLPGRYVQLIPRPIKHFNTIRVDSLDETDRGEGGFGSTN